MNVSCNENESSTEQFGDNSIRSISTLPSPVRPRRVKRHDSSQTLTKEMISKAFQKRLPRPDQPKGVARIIPAKFSDSFTSISVENGLSSPTKRPLSTPSPRRTRSSGSLSQKRKDCLPKSKLLSESIPELPFACPKERSKVSSLPERDALIDKNSIQAYDDHKKYFATCRPSRRKVQFSERIDDRPLPINPRVEDLSWNDLSLPAPEAMPTFEQPQQLSNEALEIERLHRELQKACGKIGKLLELVAEEDEETRRLEAENKKLRRRLRRLGKVKPVTV